MNMPVAEAKNVASLFLLTEDEQKVLNKKAVNILDNLQNGNYEQKMIN